MKIVHVMWFDIIYSIKDFCNVRKTRWEIKEVVLYYVVIHDTQQSADLFSNNRGW